MNSRLKTFSLATLAAAALVACGGGSDDGSAAAPAQPTPTSVSGLATKGPLLGATVVAYEVVGGQKSKLGETKTSLDTGTFKFDFDKKISNPVCLEVTGAAGSDMLSDDGTGTKIKLTEEIKMSSCAPAGATQIGINPFTDLAAKSIEGNISAESIEKANAAVAVLADVNPLAAEFKDLQTKLLQISNASCTAASSSQFCGVANLSSVFQESISSYVKNADKDALTASLVSAAANPLAPLLYKPTPKPETNPGTNPETNPETNPGTNPGVVTNDDARYGMGGSIIASGTAFPLEDVPSGYTQAEANYFVFRITDKSNFATGQYYTAGKLTHPSNTDFTGYDFKFFSVQSTDGWKKNEWSEVRFGKETADGQVLVACTGTTGAGSERTIVAISEKATVVTDATKLHGKTFKEYSCGVDQKNWSDYANNNKSPFDYAETISISSTGDISSDGESFGVNVSTFLSKNGVKESDYHVYATAYELNGQYFVLQKDYDTTRTANASKYGLSLMIGQ